MKDRMSFIAGALGAYENHQGQKRTELVAAAICLSTHIPQLISS